MGVEIKTGVEVGKDVTLKELREQGYKAFYIAIGCSAGRDPACPETTRKAPPQPLIICGGQHRQDLLHRKSRGRRPAET